MKLVYPAIFTPCVKKEGFTVIVPDLPGCVSEGDSLIHAIEHGTDAASGWILDELEEGNDIPLQVIKKILSWKMTVLSLYLYWTWIPILKNTDPKQCEKISPFPHG